MSTMPIAFKRRLILSLAGLALALPVHAHHGWSSYDADKVITMEVPLQAVRYRNPHAEVEVDYEGRRREVVLAPISRMQARGLSEEMLQVGKTVRIVGYPKSDGSPELRAERITVDGKTVELR